MNCKQEMQKNIQRKEEIMDKCNKFAETHKRNMGMTQSTVNKKIRKDGETTNVFEKMPNIFTIPVK